MISKSVVSLKQFIVALNRDRIHRAVKKQIYKMSIVAMSDCSRRRNISWYLRIQRQQRRHQHQLSCQHLPMGHDGIVADRHQPCCHQFVVQRLDEHERFQYVQPVSMLMEQFPVASAIVNEDIQYLHFPSTC